MRGRHLGGAVVAAAAFAALSCATEQDAVIVDATSGLETRPVPETCREFDVRPGEARAERAYPALVFARPVEVVRHPVEPYWYVVEGNGVIRRFVDRPDASETEVVIDLGDAVANAGFEDGLLGLAFDPEFGANGAVILKYTAPAAEPGRVRLVVARARSLDGGASIAPDSIEEILSIDRPAEAIHHGGPPAYGRDGYLYVPVGDGGYDSGHLAQDLASLAGKVLRIDTRASPYVVPSDNPFVGRPGARPEIFALGFRNPHGWSFDPTEPVLWIGDVGLHTYEELNEVRSGQNFGWPIREGAHCKDGLPCDPTGLVDPIHEYMNFGGAAIVGGPVYEGSRFPSVRGNVVFGDFISGRIHHVPRDGSAAPGLLVEAGRNITSITRTPDGEILFTDYMGGLWSVAPKVGGRSVPALLSETGCVDPAHPTTPPPGLLPYEVAMPLWSDGTDKVRWMSVPEQAMIHVREDGDFDMPTGTVLVKTFLAGGRPIETRLFIRHADGEWAGYTYEWNDDAQDAVLLESGKMKDVNGAPYTFPSRAQCMACHTPAAGFSLGLEAAQLNHGIVYPNRVRANQLATMEHVGLFDAPLDAATTSTRFPLRDDRSAEAGAWARAYLHSNCSHCHRPGGPGRGVADLRASSAVADMGCDVAPSFDVLGRVNPRIIAPGDPAASIIVARLEDRGLGAMPPLGRSTVDDLAVERIATWIRGLDSCAPR